MSLNNFFMSSLFCFVWFGFLSALFCMFSHINSNIHTWVYHKMSNQTRIYFMNSILDREKMRKKSWSDTENMTNNNNKTVYVYAKFCVFYICYPQKSINLVLCCRFCWHTTAYVCMFQCFYMYVYIKAMATTTNTKSQM